MKRLLFFCAAMLVMSSLFASTPAEMQASEKRIAQLTEMKKPAQCKVAKVDQLADIADQARTSSIEISATVNRFYELTVGGETVSMEDLEKLAAKIAGQSKVLGDATSLMAGAADDIKSAKGPAALKAPKSLAFSKDVIGLVTEETAFQGKFVSSLMQELTN